MRLVAFRKRLDLLKNGGGVKFMEKLNVAIADDNEKMVEVLGQIIEEDKDLELVGKAHNGEEICNIIREKEPDVVVLDIIMPKMDGLAVMEKFANDKSLKKIPSFIVVSAVGQERITENADRKSTRLNSSHKHRSRMPSSA